MHAWCGERARVARLAHVLLGGQHKLVIDDPLRVPIEERGGGVDVDYLSVVHRLVALLRVLLRRVHEEARRDRLAHLRVVLAARAHLELVTVHDGKQLFAHVLRPPHRAGLDEVLEAPGIGELGVGPRLRGERQTRRAFVGGVVRHVGWVGVYGVEWSGVVWCVVVFGVLCCVVGCGVWCGMD